jgi:hypothetical protein
MLSSNIKTQMLFNEYFVSQARFDGGRWCCVKTHMRACSLSLSLSCLLRILLKFWIIIDLSGIAHHHLKGMSLCLTKNHAMKMYGGSRGIVPPFLTLVLWRWVVSFTPQLLYPQVESLVPIGQEAGWTPHQVWMLWSRDKSLAPVRNWTPNFQPLACRYTDSLTVT